MLEIESRNYNETPPQNQNLYIYNNIIYFDYFKDKKGIKKSIGLKHSALSFDFVRKNYEHFIQCF
ncbi:hypothetical protein [Campylobacter helveticus]|uniref:hypothetical protein n=1 Tax=Campylobacter helveticus TaxID=28898 RepID=UPI0022EA2A7F|nr:hypothetical protein [Campylobacter helveticus]